MGQPGAPGTVVAVTGAAAAVTGRDAMTGVAALTGAVVTGAVVTAVAVRGAAVTLDAATHPGADAATTAPTAIQRPACHAR